MAPLAGAPGLVVLRSVGKFFGLAGARVGFVFAEARVLEALAERLGPWAVSGPARRVTAAALADTAWQAEARRSLARDSRRLAVGAGGCTRATACAAQRQFRQRGGPCRSSGHDRRLTIGVPR